MEEDLSRFVPKVHFELLPIKNLVSSQTYQRNLSLSHIQRTVENFDLHQINPVKVSRRDGINYVFNGQHTIEVIAAVSGSRDTPVWCMIYDDMDYTVEADTFANQQKYIKPLIPYEIFMANIEAGNDQQLIIRDLVQSYGLDLSSTKQVGCICAISTLESIFTKHGFHVLDRTLRLICSTWEGDVNSFAANMLNGVARLVVVYGDKLSDAMFKEKVGAASVREITRTAKDRRAGSLGFAETMLIQYNKKTKNGLRWSNLYSHKGRPYERIDGDYFASLMEEEEAEGADFDFEEGLDDE